MNQEGEQQEQIPEEEREYIDAPFQVGDLVMMRSKSLKLIKFYHFPENDVGLVLEMKRSIHDEWLVNVHWQKFKPKKGKCIVKHTRLKKVRIKKNVP